MGKQNAIDRTNSMKSPKAQSQVDKWNRLHKIGTQVTRYAAIEPLGYPMETKTNTIAFVSQSGHAVIFVEGVSGYVLLESLVVK